MNCAPVVVQEHERGLEIVELLRDRSAHLSHYQDLLDSGQGLVDIIASGGDSHPL